MRDQQLHRNDWTGNLAVWEIWTGGILDQDIAGCHHGPGCLRVKHWNRSPQNESLYQAISGSYSGPRHHRVTTHWIWSSRVKLHQAISEWHPVPDHPWLGHHKVTPWTRSFQGHTLGQIIPGSHRQTNNHSHTLKDSSGFLVQLTGGFWIVVVPRKHSKLKSLRGGTHDLVYREGWTSLCVCLLMFCVCNSCLHNH